MSNELEIKKVRITEFAKDDDRGTGEVDIESLSLIDIQAAIAKQAIPVSALFSKQDLAGTREVMSLVHEAETKVKTALEKEIIIMGQKNESLQKFKDKAETSTLVRNSGELTDKDEQLITYIQKRLGTGRGVDLSGDLTDIQRQDKINEAIKEELTLIDEEGITFKQREAGKPGGPKFDKDEFADKNAKDGEDMTDPNINPLVPAEDETKT